MSGGFGSEPAHKRRKGAHGRSRPSAPLAPAEDGKVLASAPAGAGIDIIRYSPRLHHLYVPGARAADLTIFDVAASGALKPIARYKTAQHAHCVADDNDGHVFVCDPRAGAILEINDH